MCAPPYRSADRRARVTCSCSCDQPARPSRPSPLRIGVLAPIAWRTPPRHYGPWELFASLLADGLVAAGHDVTLFATADSITTGDAPQHVTARVERGRRDRTQGRRGAAHRRRLRARRRPRHHPQRLRLPPAHLQRARRHRRWSRPSTASRRRGSCPVYERYDATTTYVAISDADRHPALHYAATIHHGIDTDAFAVDPHPGDHLLFFGRIHPDKGTADAIDGRPPSRPPPRHRRDHPRPAVLRRAGRAAPRRRPRPLHRPGRAPPSGPPCSAPPTRCCTSSTSTSRSATASSRRWRAAHPSSPTPGARCPSSSPTASPASSSTAIDEAVRAVDAGRRARPGGDPCRRRRPLRPRHDGRALRRRLPVRARDRHDPMVRSQRRSRRQPDAATSVE